MDAQAMTDFDLVEPGLLALRAGGWLAAGALIGSVHFSLLRSSVRIFVQGRARLVAFALQLGRAALLAGMLAVVARRFGAWRLLLATGGILAARTAAVRLEGQK
jgi:hypothetical protein